MENSGQIHWHEGLFLQPQHLQHMQRHLLGRLIQERSLGWPYPYGLIESRLSSDELQNMRVRFDRLRLIMPSGLEIHVPDNTDLPALDIKEAFESHTGSFILRLGVPLYYGHRGNTIQSPSKDDWREKRLYRVSEVQEADENTGENPQPVMVRRINARLLGDQDDPTDLEVLPLLRISHAAGEDVGLPRQDPSFVPACLVLGGSPALRELVRDLANQVEASRKELAIQVTRGGQTTETMRGVQFEQVLRLRTLGGFGGVLASLAAAATISPFSVYLVLRQLLGELAALRPERDLFDVGEYDHDNPAVVFNDLSGRIRSLLRGAVAARFLQAPLTLDSQKQVLVASLSEEHLTAPNEYFLGIRTKEEARAIAALVEDRDKFRMVPVSLYRQRVFGVKLVEERYPPLELPSQQGLHYFRLLRAESARMWERIQQEKIVAINWTGVESTDWTFTLYMTLPEEGSKA